MSNAPPSAGQLVRHSLVVLPGLAAAGLAILYATGALLKTAQLRGAKLVVRDTFPLVPLEQVLATGIGTVAVSLLALIGFAALFAFFWWLTRPKPQVARPQKRGLAGRRFPRWWPWLSPLHILLVSLPMAVVAGYLFWSIPVFDVLIVLAGAVNSFFAFEYRKLGRRGAMLFVAVYFGIALGANIASAFVYPKPLPEARLVLRGGNSVVGGLIARDGGTWFVTTKPKTYRALPADRIVTAIVRSRKRAEEPTPVLKGLWRWISG